MMRFWRRDSTEHLELHLVGMELLPGLGIVNQNWRRGELLAVLGLVAVHQVHELLRSVRVDVPARPRVYDQYQGACCSMQEAAVY